MSAGTETTSTAESGAQLNNSNSTSAPVSHLGPFNMNSSLSRIRHSGPLSPQQRTQQTSGAGSGSNPYGFPVVPELHSNSSIATSASAASASVNSRNSSGSDPVAARRRRHSDGRPMLKLDMRSFVAHATKKSALLLASPNSNNSSKANVVVNDSSAALAKERARSAQKVNDSMVYLDGPQVYTCAQCRTHLTSHDDIISKSFHGRHGRAYLFDQCVNITIGPPEDRLLITGLHSVCDMFCKRCKIMVGWTYSKAYEPSQKYKEGKFIIEKINLHLEESNYDVEPPAGERPDRWRRRSMSWGTDRSRADHQHSHHESCPTLSLSSPPMSPMSPRSCNTSLVYEYRPSSPA